MTLSYNHVMIVFQVIVFMFAISVHESAHAWMAWRLGDPTARMLGRVTLNPLRHIDPVGTVILPLLAIITHFPVIGWAKPTPVDPRNFRHYVRDDILTSVAGPVSNFLVASGSVLLLVLITFVSPEADLAVKGLALGAGLDPTQTLAPIILLLYTGMQINVLLGIFNLIPVPPLDGSHVLRHFLSSRLRAIYDNVGIFGLLLLMLFGGSLLGFLMFPVVDLFRKLLLRL